LINWLDSEVLEDTTLDGQGYPFGYATVAWRTTTDACAFRQEGDHAGKVITDDGVIIEDEAETQDLRNYCVE